MTSGPPVNPRLGDVALTALAPAAWGLTYLATTEFLPPGRPLLAGAARALPAGLALAAVARRRPQVSGGGMRRYNLIGFTWLATGGTAVAYLLWFRGIAKLPVSQVSLLGLASPIVATLADWVVVHQTLAYTQLLGGVLVLTALWCGQRPHRPNVGARLDECVRRRSVPLRYLLPERRDLPAVELDAQAGVITPSKVSAQSVGATMTTVSPSVALLRMMPPVTSSSA